MPNIVNFKKQGLHAGEDTIIRTFINSVLIKDAVWQEIFVTPTINNTVTEILNEISQEIRQIEENELAGFGLDRRIALDSLNTQLTNQEFHLSTELYKCVLDDIPAREYTITYKQILAATYRLLIKDKPPAAKKEAARLFVGILQNNACAGGRANTCIEHYNNAINQREEARWKVIPANADFLLHYLINFYSHNPVDRKVGVIPKPDNNKFLQICWAIFEKYTLNNVVANEAIGDIIANMSPHEHFGGPFMAERDNINAARSSLEEYQDANGNILGLDDMQKAVLAQTFNQQHPHRPLNVQENALIQRYVIDENDQTVFTPLSIEKVKEMWDDLINKSMVFGGGVIPMPDDNVRIDFNNPKENQPFIIDEVNNDYIINHARLAEEQGHYEQTRAEVYLNLSQRFFGERDENITKLFASTVSRRMDLFNNHLNLQTIANLKDLDNEFRERLELLATGMLDREGLNLIADEHEKKLAFIDSNWDFGLNFKQEIVALFKMEQDVLKQLELNKHLRVGDIINQDLTTKINNKAGKLVFAEAVAYTATSKNIRLFLDKLSDDEAIRFFNLKDRASLQEARGLGEELRLLNVRLFEVIPSLLRKRDGSVHKGDDAIIDVEDKYNQNPDLRSHKKFLQICYASIAEAVPHFTQNDIDNDVDIKLISNTFNFRLDTNDDNHFEGINRGDVSIDQAKQALTDFRNWVVNGKQGNFPGLRLIDVQILEDLEVIKVAPQQPPVVPVVQPQVPVVVHPQIPVVPPVQQIDAAIANVSINAIIANVNRLVINKKPGYFDDPNGGVSINAINLVMPIDEVFTAISPWRVIADMNAADQAHIDVIDNNIKILQDWFDNANQILGPGHQQIIDIERLLKQRLINDVITPERQRLEQEALVRQQQETALRQQEKNTATAEFRLLEQVIRTLITNQGYYNGLNLAAANIPNMPINEVFNRISQNIPAGQAANQTVRDKVQLLQVLFNRYQAQFPARQLELTTIQQTFKQNLDGIIAGERQRLAQVEAQQQLLAQQQAAAAAPPIAPPQVAAPPTNVSNAVEQARRAGRRF